MVGLLNTSYRNSYLRPSSHLDFSFTGYRSTTVIAFQITQLLVLFQKIYFRFVSYES